MEFNSWAGNHVLMKFRLSLLLLFPFNPAQALPGTCIWQQEEVGEAQAVSDAVRERISERCLDYLWELHESQDFPGAMAALILPDGSEIQLPVGYADLESESEMSPSARLLSGSIGKTYVSAAAHKLMLEGKLDFDALAATYFEEHPWFERVPNAGSITVRQLLRHQSGIARHVFKPKFLPDCFASPDRVWKPKELLSYILDDAPLFPAGEDWAYADTNFVVLGMIIEKQAGMTFYDYVRQSFLDPLGLSDTVPSDSRRVPGLVQGYIKAFAQADGPSRTLSDGVFYFNPQFEWCGGGYASTASDLARWAHMLYGGKAMQGDYLDVMLDGVAARLGPGKRYGHGVMLSDSALGPEAGHDGIMMGYSATVGHLLKENLSFSLMLNTDDQRALGQPRDRVARHLAAIALEELKR